MKRFELLVEGQARSLEVEGTTVVCGDREVQTDVADLGPGAYSIVIDGTQHEVSVADLGGGIFDTSVDGSRLRIEVLDPRRLARRENPASRGGSVEIRAPMPGKVLAVRVGTGQEVKRGQGLVVVEAMKMQNELKAPKDGTITAISVAVGDAVAAGSALVAID